MVVADAEVERLGLAFGKMETDATFEHEKTTVHLGLGAVTVGACFLSGLHDRVARRALGESVVAFHETARAANHEQAHHLAPVVGMFALLERREAIQRALVAARELVRAAIAVAAQIFLGPDADDVFGFEKKPELVGEVEVGLVVGRGRKQNALAGVARDVVANDGPTSAFAISQVVAFVNDDDAVATQVRQDALGLGDGHDFRDEAVTMCVVLPHADEILGAKDECFE